MARPDSDYRQGAAPSARHKESAARTIEQGPVGAGADRQEAHQLASFRVDQRRFLVDAGAEEKPVGRVERDPRRTFAPG